MIKQKLLEFLIWLRKHFHFLVEVVVRLSVGIEKLTNNQEDVTDEDSNKKGD